MLDRSVVAESDTVEARELLIFSCLAPQTARAVFLDSIIAGISEDEIVEIDADVVVCLGEWVAELDVFSTMVALSVDNPEAAGVMVTALMTCAQDLVVALMLEETGLTREELSEDEASCLRAWVADTDWTTLPASSTDGSVRFDILPGLFDCVPDLLRSEPGERPWGEVIEEGTPVEIGVATQGAVNFGDDGDFFAFEADEGEYYQLDVTLGTLENSVLEIFDAPTAPGWASTTTTAAAQERPGSPGRHPAQAPTTSMSTSK
ncbi:MAG: hypothetical protein J4G11_02485 [Acidimicrobiia bacterium]|nr:hypothetical protein [Acidimicrobiia bacterium]